MKKLIATIALIGLLSVSVLAGDVNAPPCAPQSESLIVKIVLFLIG